MKLIEAKKFVGQTVQLSYADRSGNLHVFVAKVYDVGYLPHNGPCLITSEGEVKLDRIQLLEPVVIQDAA